MKFSMFIFQDLEKSKHASDALGLARLQEETLQKQQETKIKEMEAYTEQLKIEQKKVEKIPNQSCVDVTLAMDNMDRTIENLIVKMEALEEKLDNLGSGQGKVIYFT